MKSQFTKKGYRSLGIIRDQLRRTCLTPIIIVLSLALTPFTILAFEYDEHNGDPVRWETDRVTFHASEVSFGYGEPFTDALETVLNRWNWNPSNFRFNLQLFDPVVEVDNGQNEVWFAKGKKKTPPAECLAWVRRDKIVEADVVFYTPSDILDDGSEIEFTSSMSKSQLTTYGGTFRPFKTTAMHEFGHALGLNHEREEYNIMGEDWTHIHVNGDTCKAYFGEDAADGAVFLYGRAPNAGEDVSVSHFMYKGWKGEYSTHRYTKFYNRDGTNAANELISTTLPSGEPEYEVYPGQVVQVQFTYENNGASTQTVDVGFYISDDNLIETSDDLIATKKVELSRDDVYTPTTTVVIPNDLVVGEQYYLGVIVDYTDSVAEFFEEDNAAHHAIKVVNQSNTNEAIQPDYSVQVEDVDVLTASTVDTHDILDNSQVLSADFTVTATVRNIGTAAAYYSISPLQIYVNGTLYQSRFVSGLGIGEETRVTFDFHVPEGPDYHCNYAISTEIGLTNDPNQENNSAYRNVHVDSYGCLGSGPTQADLNWINENAEDLLDDKFEGLNYEQWGTDYHGNLDVGSNAPILDRLDPLP